MKRLDRTAGAMHQFLSRCQASYVRSLLVETGGNVTEAAKAAGISRNHMHRLVNQYGLRNHGRVSLGAEDRSFVQPA